MELIHTFLMLFVSLFVLIGVSYCDSTDKDGNPLSDLTVRNGIRGEEVTQSISCQVSRADVQDKRFYYQFIVGHGWIHRRCPQGTGFSNITCQCTNRITVATKGCEPEFYFNFDDDAKDHSNNALPVGVSNIKITNKTGEFTGKSKLIMWRYSGAEFRNGLSAKLSYKPAGKSDQQQAILTNCDSSKSKPSIGVVLKKSSQGDELLIFVRLQKSGDHILKYHSRNNDWNDVTFSFTGNELTGTVNGVTKTTGASGTLVKGSSGIVLGRCEYYKWFTGYMEEVKIYPCVPAAFRPK